MLGSAQTPPLQHGAVMNPSARTRSGPPSTRSAEDSSTHDAATNQENGITSSAGLRRQVTRAHLMPLAKGVFKMNSCLKQAKGVSLAGFSFFLIFLFFSLSGR